MASQVLKRLVRWKISEDMFYQKNQKNKGWQRTLVKWNRKIDFLKWIETPFLRSSPIEVCSVCFMFDYRWLLWLSWWLSRMTSWASFPYPLLYPNSSWRLWSWTRWGVNLNTRVDRGRCTCRGKKYNPSKFPQGFPGGAAVFFCSNTLPSFDTCK